MGWPLRMQEQTLIYFVTVRCAQARLLLRPSERTNDVVGGVLARAVERSECRTLWVQLCLEPRPHVGSRSAGKSSAVHAVPAHEHLEEGRRAHQLERVVLGKPILGRASARRRRLARTCQVHPLSRGEGRTRPDLSGIGPDSARCQSSWERPTGASAGSTGADAGQSAPARGVPDRFEARFGERELLRITPLPLKRFRRQSAWRRFVKRALAAIEDQGRRAHQHVLGRAGVFAQDPHHRPERTKRSRRPWCHAVSARLRIGFISRYRAFVAAFAMASERWRRGELSAVFPPNAHRPFLRPPRTSLPPS